MSQLPSPLMESWFFENDFYQLRATMSRLVNDKRQFAVAFDEVGRAALSSPIVDRGPKVDQPSVA